MEKDCFKPRFDAMNEGSFGERKAGNQHRPSLIMESGFQECNKISKWLESIKHRERAKRNTKCGSLHWPVKQICGFMPRKTYFLHRGMPIGSLPRIVGWRRPYSILEIEGSPIFLFFLSMSEAGQVGKDACPTFKGHCEGATVVRRPVTA